VIFLSGIAAFFTTGELFRPALITAFLRRLTKIESWFLEQSSMQFFASSLLLVYDVQAISMSVAQDVVPLGGSDEILNNETFDGHCNSFSNKSDLPESDNRNGLGPVPATSLCESSTASTGYDEFWFDRHIDVRMIDFAHVFPSTTSSVDTNYLTGLRSLISYLSRLTPATYDPF
jgi:hypothetical protein